MATKYNTQGRVPANYPGLFNARENRMITHNYAVVALVDENYTVLPEDGITHLTIEAATAAVTVTMPAPALCKGRLMKVYVSDATETVTVDVAGGNTQYTAGSYEIFCDGTDYLRVF
jgi:hypothetical protein